MDNILTNSYGHEGDFESNYDAENCLILLPVSHFLKLFPKERGRLKARIHNDMPDSQQDSISITNLIDSVVYCESNNSICGLIYAYQLQHYPSRQPRVDDIIIDPILRTGFCSDEIELRPRAELLSWWNVPYIETVEYKQIDDTYQDYVFRMRNIGFQDADVDPLDLWMEHQAENKEMFYRHNPSGKYYLVKMLDGGSHDRPTEYARAEKLDDAVAFVKNRLLASSGGPVFPGQLLS